MESVVIDYADVHWNAFRMYETQRVYYDWKIKKNIAIRITIILSELISVHGEYLMDYHIDGYEMEYQQNGTFVLTNKIDHVCNVTLFKTITRERTVITRLFRARSISGTFLYRYNWNDDVWELVS